jgi:hypothetical protein
MRKKEVNWMLKNNKYIWELISGYHKIVYETKKLNNDNDSNIA